MINDKVVNQINDYESLIEFLRDELEWPIPFDVKSERITYEYLSDELRLSDEDQKHLEGNIKQLIPFRQNQPWGIFLLELTKPKAYISLLRKIVRGLVPSKRKTSELSSWHHENVLLICTYKYEYFTFARFEGEHYSNAKITTFSWSPDEPVRTLCEHNLPALKWPADDGENAGKWLKDWASAFDVEKVTKKFFQEYKQLYELLYQDLSNNHIFRNQAVKHNLDASNFAKKLLGQIVFIYFIQKKGWLGVPRGENWGNGDKRFLRNLFDDCIVQSDNYFNNYLEPLFYDALNNPRRNEVDPSYHAKFKCKIPFLNGGLFEPDYDWAKSNIYIDNKIFEQILNTFDSYNFTVKEDTPLDVEVAVDPEMLGKVFENLLEENLRKGKGTYYTPREIVHYMCQESLVNYLTSESGIKDEEIRNLVLSTYVPYSQDEISQTVLSNAEKLDELLVGIKVVDPACGSGAFLVGMLHEIVNLRLMLQKILFTEDSTISEYQIKKDTIQNCIYGVDIDPGAIEIAKLRLWLSLVVDYDLEDIEPLPNLDYKIMQGNSLLEVLVLGERTIKLFDSAAIGIKNVKYLNLFEQDNRLTLFDHDETTKEIFDKYHKWQIELFNAKTIEKKKDARENLKNIESELIEETLKAEILHLDVAEKNIGKKLYSGFGVDKKDAEKQAKILSLRSRINEVLNEIKTIGNRPYFLWHLYFGDVFVEKGGFDVVIANPPYVRADSPDFKAQRAAILRSKFYETLYEKWDLFLPFIERGLKLLNDSGNLGYITSNSLLTSKFAFRLLEFIQKNYAVQYIDYFSDDTKVFEAGVVPVVFGIARKAINSDVRKTIHQGEFNHIIKQETVPTADFKASGKEAFKLSSNSFKSTVKATPLGDICYLSYGLRPNSDERFWKGEFKKGDLISPTRSRIHNKPYVEGKDIESYKIKKIRYLEWDTDRVPKKLVRPTFPDLYTNNKLICGRVTSGTYDETGLICNDSSIVFKRFVDLKSIDNRSIHNSIAKFNKQHRDKLENISEQFNLKYILAILNSKFANNFLNGIRRHRLKNYFYPDDFRKLPIADIPTEEQQPFIELVDKILDITKDDDYLQNPAKQAKVREYEKQIDKLVYKLYGLTLEEEAIVEGSN